MRRFITSSLSWSLSLFLSPDSVFWRATRVLYSSPLVLTRASSSSIDESFSVRSLMRALTISYSLAPAEISAVKVSTISKDFFALSSLSVISMRSSLIFDESASIFSSASSISRCLSSLWSRRAWMLRLILSRFDLCCSICASCERRPLIAFLREPPVTSPPLAYTSPSRVTILNARSYFFQMRSALSILSTMTTLPSSALTKSSNLGS